ncbi:DNA-directed DNA/RNA polymerase mu [Hyla sarda]|uniref:DNA-directed DNA/RNA polymerase mu n=1 Tax=Hyla sarda TaxID=327740 RepID=UPI0024C3BED7|nr:DNA-directed DNA/RNA polymerase mu [Hyla sarda]XP_056427285.1 DNA-directed DNA/RNA polymerase mu [Hyla sarda]XP_056427286.1 DNA-directed DNA/RNA polymerase mu [Hyla sarda]XP_056427288.1 DNA-directed DNA/RNA polymerase mu [Hyla sarda]XP_056427289.1 DNA-directed DNA/RNA polymerase mu [Hyla sarda]XP_056427290.1 DNA-directed DNA/RNA polymerase mu [Hyla sarda]XP_056427291.1 DNA-directed DNA/RNA polymerase mu [Hyla sarda]XP_056427292.1 DNA-directed DNA/RNA polymerase mu [Hyla sarda]
MLPFPIKRRRKEAAVAIDPGAPHVVFPDICIFLVERRMGAARRGFLTSLAQRKGFSVAQEYSGAVTHVVSEQNSFTDVLSWIERKTGKPMQSAEDQMSPHILDISWFTESMSSGKPVPVEATHRLGILGSQVSKDKDALSTVAPYACQRRTPLTHHNSEITEALEILGKAAAFQGSEVRNLAFSRAASVLKSLPSKLQSAEEARNLVWCGGHCQAVIQEILEDGVCHEVEALKICEQYQCMELLTGIFGVGVRTAERWYKDGVRKLRDLENPNIKLTADQRAGIEHYTDLKQPVTLQEARHVERLITDALHRFVPDLEITMTGGFRRGKQQGHDVDFLITHPSEESLNGVLKKAVDWMDSQGLLLYHHTKVRSRVLAQRRSTHMDGHETCYAIFALPSLDSMRCEAGAPGAHTWRAVRVDLVVTPYEEYPFALLGWTGSKHFERELRRYSWHEKNLSLNSHGLYDTQKNCSIPATSEEEIFALLGLDYVPPPYRNA